MGKNCGNCKSACGKSKGPVKSFSYLLKEVSTGDYLDIDTYDDSSSNFSPIYYLHGEPKYALRFATRHEALQVLGKVLTTGLDIQFNVRPNDNGFAYLQFKVVKRVKRSRV